MPKVFKNKNKQSNSRENLLKIQAMLKLIPNNFPVTLEDLEEIFKNEIRPMAARSNED
jgi:hypothetical protein